jgi:hypothetical protein
MAFVGEVLMRLSTVLVALVNVKVFLAINLRLYRDMWGVVLSVPVGSLAAVPVKKLFQPPRPTSHWETLDGVLV